MQPTLYEKQIESIRGKARAWARVRGADLVDAEAMRFVLGFVLVTVDSEGMAIDACGWTARVEGRPRRDASAMVPGVVACSLDDGRMYLSVGGDDVNGAKAWARLLPAMVPEVAA